MMCMYVMLCYVMLCMYACIMIWLPRHRSSCNALVQPQRLSLTAIALRRAWYDIGEMLRLGEGEQQEDVLRKRPAL